MPPLRGKGAPILYFHKYGGACLHVEIAWLLTLDAHCCHMGTAVKHLVPDRVKPSFVIFDIRAL